MVKKINDLTEFLNSFWFLKSCINKLLENSNHIKGNISNHTNVIKIYFICLSSCIYKNNLPVKQLDKIAIFTQVNIYLKNEKKIIVLYLHHLNKNKSLVRHDRMRLLILPPSWC